MLTRMKRCDWARLPHEVRYHDREWGVPLHGDRRLFELLILEGAQAGLSWSLILSRRAAYRRAFDRFDAARIAGYGPRDVARLMADAGIIRNRLKIAAAIANARAFLAVQAEFASRGGFDGFLWQFVDHRPRINRFRRAAQVPARTRESDEMSTELRRRGFKFVGSTICYAFMQASGMVNDHLVGCFRHGEVGRGG